MYRLSQIFNRNNENKHLNYSQVYLTRIYPLPN